MKNKVKEFVKWLAYIGDVLVGLLFLLAVIGLCVLGLYTILRHIGLRPADDMPPDGPSEGVAWVMPEAGEVPVWLSPVCAGEAETAVWLDHYTEGDGPAPEWWRPDEEMAVEWEGHSGEANKMVDEDDVTDINVRDINVPCNTRQSDAVDYNPHPPIGIDPGGVDWNLCSTVWGWDGHSMEAWEMDLFSRIVFLEFGITSTECREAGIDAILRLWESGYYSSTMFGTLSAVTENGKPAFSTYSEVWNEEYDYEKLARIREECEERFVNGPEWTAPFFRTGHYHEWAEPCYAFVEDNVYFSTGKGWN